MQTVLQSIQTTDVIMVGVAGAIFVGAGLLQKSLGNVMEEESNLPSAAGARSSREAQRSKRFLKKKPTK